MARSTGKTQQMKEFDELEDDELDYWLELATEHLMEHGFIPFTDEVWTSDKYFEKITNTAREMYEDSLL